MEQNIPERFVSQFLKHVMNLILILLKNRNKYYVIQTRSQLKNSKNTGMDKNEDNINNKLMRNIEVTNKVEKKRGRPRSRSKITGTF